MLLTTNAAKSKHRRFLAKASLSGPKSLPSKRVNSGLATASNNATSAKAAAAATSVLTSIRLAAALPRCC
jgi:hypothetical protein